MEDCIHDSPGIFPMRHYDVDKLLDEALKRADKGFERNRKRLKVAIRDHSLEAFFLRIAIPFSRIWGKSDKLKQRRKAIVEHKSKLKEAYKIFV